MVGEETHGREFRKDRVLYLLMLEKDLCYCCQPAEGPNIRNPFSFWQTLIFEKY